MEMQKAWMEDKGGGGELLFAPRDPLGRLSHGVESSKYFSSVWNDIVCGF